MPTSIVCKRVRELPPSDRGSHSPRRKFLDQLSSWTFYLQAMKTLVRLCILIALSVQSAGALAEWTLQAVPQRLTEGWVLNLTLERNGKGQLRSYASDLPWGVRDRLTIIAFPLEDGTQALRQPMVIDDLRQDPITIEPAAKLQGRISLSNRFPDLMAVNQRSSIAVCYHYAFAHLQPSNQQVAEECFVLRKQAR